MNVHIAIFMLSMLLVLSNGSYANLIALEFNIHFNAGFNGKHLLLNRHFIYLFNRNQNSSHCIARDFPACHGTSLNFKG